jgi:hypothetical protein
MALMLYKDPLVDSTDDTLQLLKRLNGITQVSQANAGASAARNQALK